MQFASLMAEGRVAALIAVTEDEVRLLKRLAKVAKRR